MFDIIYQPSNARRRVFHVAGTHCIVGRARSADLIIDSRSVAKRHAELSQLVDGLYVRDLGTPSGTYVNRQRVVDYGPLDELDEVLIGNVRISFQKVVFNEVIPNTGIDEAKDKQPLEYSDLPVVESILISKNKNNWKRLLKYKTTLCLIGGE